MQQQQQPAHEPTPDIKQITSTYEIVCRLKFCKYIDFNSPGDNCSNSQSQTNGISRDNCSNSENVQLLQLILYLFQKFQSSKSYSIEISS